MKARQNTIHEDLREFVYLKHNLVTIYQNKKSISNKLYKHAF
jgi:hypothetical protein